VTDDEIAQFMGWSRETTARMSGDPESFVGRTRRLVDEAQRRERERWEGALRSESRTPPCALLKAGSGPR
jgi:hypothetical protein